MPDVTINSRGSVHVFYTVRMVFPYGDNAKMMAQGFLDLFLDAAPHLEHISNFSSSALKRHLLKRHLTLICPNCSLCRKTLTLQPVFSLKYRKGNPKKARVSLVGTLKSLEEKGKTVKKSKENQKTKKKREKKNKRQGLEGQGRGGGRQKGIGKKVTKNEQKVTKK